MSPSPSLSRLGEAIRAKYDVDVANVQWLIRFDDGVWYFLAQSEDGFRFGHVSEDFSQVTLSFAVIADKEDALRQAWDYLRWIGEQTFEAHMAQLFGAKQEEEREMTTAQQIAHRFPDGTTFETAGGQHLSDLCRQHAVHIDTDTDRELTRYVFADGSAIVEGVGGWDIEGATPFSWAGA